MRDFIASYMRDETAAAAAEYALILAIVGSGIALAATNLGGAIVGALGNAAGWVTGAVPAPGG